MGIARKLTGFLLLLASVAPLLVGGLLWTVVQSRAGADGTLTATTRPLDTVGHAVVVPDVAALVAKDGVVDASVIGRLGLSARAADGQPVFVGLAEAADARAYLDGVAHAEVRSLQLRDGPLPVGLTEVAGTRAPAPPAEAPFWITRSLGEPPGAGISWRPEDVPEGTQLALVMMRMDAAAPVALTATGTVELPWLHGATWGMLGFGGLLVLMGVALLMAGRRPSSRPGPPVPPRRGPGAPEEPRPYHRVPAGTAEKAEDAGAAGSR